MTTNFAPPRGPRARAEIVPPPRVSVLGVGISALTLPDAVDRILSAAEAGQGGYVCIRDVHGVIRCQDDPELRAIHNEAFLVTPDGMPLVWALRRGGHPGAGRVYGPDLMRAVFEAGQATGLRHFLYGTTPRTLERLSGRLIQMAPEALIAGTHSPPFRPLTDEEEAQAALMIERSGADIAWVGLSTPKQERWMARMQLRLPNTLLIGVGAAFDFHAGDKRQAPPVLQRSGLEWVFRLATEPRRLWRRYAVTVPRYLWLRGLERSGLR